MTATEVLIKQIKGCSDFFQSQEKMNLPEPVRKQSMDGMAKGLLQQMSSLGKMRAEDITELNGAVCMSLFSEEHKAQIGSALAVLQMDTPGAGAGFKGQTFLHPMAYFTEPLWKLWLNPEVSMGQKVFALSDACRLSDCLHGSEQTLKALACMLAASIWPHSDPSEAQLNALLNKIKDDIVTQRHPSNLGMMLAVYPRDPHDLPKIIYDRMYSVDPPITKELDRYAEFFRKKFSRCSARNVPKPGGQPKEEYNVVQQLLMQLQATPQQVSQPCHVQLQGLQQNAAFSAVAQQGCSLAGLPRKGMPLQLPCSTWQKPAAMTSTPETMACLSSKPEWPPEEGLMNQDLEAEEGEEVEGGEGKEESENPILPEKGQPETPAKAHPTKAKDKVAAMENLLKASLHTGATQKIKKRPAAAKAELDIKKKPSSCQWCDKRPFVPHDTHKGKALYYGPGRVLVSQSLQAYRVFMYKGARAEKRVFWSQHSSRSGAWSQALDLIDDSVTQ